MSEHEIGEQARNSNSARYRTQDKTHLIGSGSRHSSSAATSVKVRAHLESLVTWYLSSQDTPPTRLVLRDVLAEDGTNEWTHEFRRWITNDHATRTEYVEEPCDHVSRRDGESCHWCGVFNEDGSVLVETGRRKYTRRLYVYPMRAAVGRVAKANVPAGFPPIGRVLFTLAGTQSVSRTVGVLMADYPTLNEVLALRHLRLALERVKDAYAPGPFPKASRASRAGKSDSQANAEAATSAPTPDLT